MFVVLFGNLLQIVKKDIKIVLAYIYKYFVNFFEITKEFIEFTAVYILTVYCIPVTKNQMFVIYKKIQVKQENFQNSKCYIFMIFRKFNPKRHS